MSQKGREEQYPPIAEKPSSSQPPRPRSAGPTTREGAPPGRATQAWQANITPTRARANHNVSIKWVEVDWKVDHLLKRQYRPYQLNNLDGENIFAYFFLHKVRIQSDNKKVNFAQFYFQPSNKM